jgi:hypothetical protein
MRDPETIKDDWDIQPIEYLLGLDESSTHVRNLHEVGIYLVGDCVHFTAEELTGGNLNKHDGSTEVYGIYGIGQRTAECIHEELRSHGFSFSRRRFHRTRKDLVACAQRRKPYCYSDMPTNPATAEGATRQPPC